jgi:hypothetical protein
MNCFAIEQGIWAGVWVVLSSLLVASFDEISNCIDQLMLDFMTSFIFCWFHMSLCSICSILLNVL